MGYRDAALADYLDANAEWRRGLLLEIDTPELLRKGTSRPQRKRQRMLLEDARQQLRQQMRERGRRACRGEVSLELSIFARAEAVPPSAPKSVKRYLDALGGIAYADDRQVAHLLVRRYAPDHPYARKAQSRGMALPPTPSGNPTVHASVLPLRLYRASYERAFRLQDELHDPYDSWGSDDDGHRFFENAWTENDFLELEDLRRERRDDRDGKGLYAEPDSELARTMREFREQRISDLEGRLILDQRPDRYARPGGVPEFEAEFLERAGLPHPGPHERWELPGHFWLPPRHTEARRSKEAAWPALVRERMAQHRGRWRILPAAFDQPLALDMAIHGSEGDRADVDNTAHTILSMFEELYCGERRGTVVAYRVYRRVGDQPGIRVQLMSDERLRQLESAIEAARELVLRRGPGGDDYWA